MMSLATKLRRGGGLLDFATMTVGTSGSGAYGFKNTSGFGSMSPNSLFAPKGNAQIFEFNWNNTFNAMNFYIAATGFGTNDGWSMVDIAGVQFLRSAATFTPDSGSALWQWSVATNPFGTTVGATRAIKWY